MTLTSSDALERLVPVGTALAGRAHELDVLRAAWGRAAAGHGGLVLLGGEAGVGKTRLAAELAAEVETAGGSVLVGRCPRGAADPYQPLVEALGPIAPPAPGVSRDALFAGLADDLARRSRHAPVLLLLDDLHAADPSTVLAICRIATALTEAAVLIVGTYRDGAVDRASPLVALLDLPGAIHILLEGLAPRDLGDIYGDIELARRLWRQSAGNPVVVGELLHLRALHGGLPTPFDALVARRLATLEPATRRVVEAAAVAGTEFSVAVAAAAAETTVPRAAAALDRAAAAGFLAADVTNAPGPTRRFVHDMVRDAIEHRIDSAARVRLHRRVARALERQDGGAPPALVAWHFRGAAPVGASTSVLRHATRAGERSMAVLAWEDAALQFGSALAAAPTASAATRADLLLSIGEAQRLAGETSRARGAFLEAAALARRAQDGTRLARAALALGHVAAVWGADPVLERLAAEARALLDQDDAPKRRGPARGVAKRPAARRQAAEPLAKPAAGRPATAAGPAPAAGSAGAPAAPVPAEPGPALASSAFFASARLYDVLDGVVAEPEPVAPEPAPAAAPTPTPAPARPALAVVAAARPRREDGGAAALLRARHGALAGPEHAAERLATADEMVALAVSTGDHDLAAAARGRRVVDLLELGRLEEAAAEHAVYAGLPGWLGVPTHGRDVETWAATLAVAAGRPADAEAAAARAFALATDAGDPDAAAAFVVQRWALALAWGSDDDLVGVADECDAAASDLASAQGWRAMAAVALARAGQDELAAEELRRATAGGMGKLRRDPGRLHPLACLAEAAWLLGDAATAATAAALLEPLADGCVVVQRGLAWRGSVARFYALAVATTGRWDDAERHLAAALAVHRRADAPALAARTRMEQARVLRARRRRGDRRRATEAERAAVEAARRLGMARLAGEAQDAPGGRAHP